MEPLPHSPSVRAPGLAAITSDKDRLCFFECGYFFAEVDHDVAEECQVGFPAMCKSFFDIGLLDAYACFRLNRNRTLEIASESEAVQSEKSRRKLFASSRFPPSTARPENFIIAFSACFAPRCRTGW